MTQSNHPHTTEKNPTDVQFQRKFWGVIVISVVAFLAYSYVLVNLFRLELTTAVYIKMAVYVIAIVLSVTSFVLALRRQVDLALTVIFYFLLIALIAGPATTQGRALNSTSTMLIIGILMIWWLLPRSSWRRNAALLAGAFALAWIFEWLDPPWRVVTKSATVGPVAAIVFAIILIVIVVRQSWSNIQNFVRRSIRNRLIAIVVSAAIIPVLAISIILGWTTYTQVRSALLQDAFDKLAAVQQIKGDQIKAYMADRQADMVALSDTMGTLTHEVFIKLSAVNNLKKGSITRQFQVWDADVRDVASDPGVVTGMVDLATGFREIGADRARALYLDKETLETAKDGSAYSAAHLEQHGFFSGYTDIHGYEDAFLIDPYGNIVYSVHKQDGFGSNLVTGVYKDSNFAALFQALKNAPAGETYIADAGQFEGELHLFMGTPIYNGSTFAGILVYQLPLAQIDAIMAEETNLGPTSETFLVALEPDGRYTMRNTRSALGPEFVIGTDVSDRVPKFVRNALAGNTGNALSLGGAGESVLASYQPMDIKGVNWAIISKIGAEAALSPTHIEGEKDYLAFYRDQYGYYDLFLISPDGYIFYTVAHEDDYKTNILTGPFSGSNLSVMVSQIVEDKEFEFADFEHYAPSGDAPAAFFGIPVLDANNQIQMIVASQVALDQLVAITNERTGLGDTGETYLVGPDQLWRSDSRFLADLGVETTVINPDFKVDTIASQSALAGESGQQEILDYRGIPVLSVWSPILIHQPDPVHTEGESWGLIAEIDQSEALGPVNTLAGSLGLVIGLAALAIGAVAVFLGTRFAVGFVTPILDLTDTATQVAAGNLDLRIASDSKDEIGTLTNTFNTMTSQLQETLSTLEQQVTDRTRALETSTEVSRRLSTILNQEQLVREVVEQLQSAFGYYHAHIYLYDAAKENLLMAGGTGDAGRIMLARGHSIEKGRGLVGRAAESNAVVLVPDTSQAEGWLPNPLLPDTKAEVAVPIAIGPNVLGVLDVQQNQINGLTQEDANLIQAIANQVAIAVQNAQAYERAQRQADRDAAIAAIGQRIQTTATIEDVLKVAVAELGQALGAQRSSVELSTNDSDNGRK